MLKFTKMQACGNDYVYIDAISQKLNNLSELAKFISDRHFGIGSDGMVLICQSEYADFRMRIFNPDGTEAEMCGNAIRSVGKFVYDYGMTDKTELQIETLGGIKHLKLFIESGKVYNIEANIGVPILDTPLVPVQTSLPKFIDESVKVLDQTFRLTALSWGNPHVVAFIKDVNDFDVAKYGKALENMMNLFPNRTNVTFAEVLDKNTIRIREWERGTGETISCGTGCCSALVAGVLTGQVNRKLVVEQLGGQLSVFWDEVTNIMYMTGPSWFVFEAEIDVSHIFN